MPEKQNSSKVVLVTGASSGIGKATSLRLIADGHKVYGAARRVELMKDLTELGAEVVSMDITVEEDIESCIHNIISKHGQLDVLVNNAGYGTFGPVETIALDNARHQFEVNLFGLASLTQKVIPRMREKNFGRIINISSMGGKIYTPFGAWYHASKHALEGWSDCLRIELEEFGIDVVLIQPGMIHTEFADRMFEPMLERSRNTAYERISSMFAEANLKLMANVDAFSPPEVIADVISKAIHSKKPKTRYAAGKMAKISLMARSLLSDRMFDHMMMSQLKKMIEKH